MLWAVLAAACCDPLAEARGENGAPVTTVEGTVLDLPTAFPDGSLRFHLAVGPRAAEGGTLPVPFGGNRETVTLLEDAFDSGAKTRWEDVLGTSTIAEGRLAANSGRNDVLLRGFQERNVRVSVEAEAAAQMGILVRYQDSNNFVMAFYTPGAKLLGFHEAVDGNLGPWLAPVSTADFSSVRVHMLVEIEGDRITATLTDEDGHAARTACTIRRITAPGRIGLYHDTTTPAPQRFDHFQLARLERRVPADAVQVVVPESVVEDSAVWPGRKHVRVKGRAGRFKTPEGPLRTLTVARMEGIATKSQEQTGKTLFPTCLPNRRWVRFPAEGLDVPACGVIYRTGDTVTNGMPLGGIDTGATDLETSGMLGYTTIFNTHVPRRGPLNVPILGISVAGRTWLLCDPQAKAGAGQYQRPLSDTRFDLKLDGLETVNEIHYWGHYPVADLEFETDAPVGVGLRAWAPFLPGALVDSMLPGTVFEVHLRNETDAPREGTIAFSFPGPLDLEAGASTFTRKRVEGALSGVEVAAPLASYLVGVIGPDKPRLGGGLSKGGGAAWSKIAESLPPDDPSQAGASAAVDFSLAPGQTKVVRFLLAWNAPEWNAGGHHGADAPHRFTHMYAKHYPSALEAAEALAANHESLLKRIP